MGADPQQSKNAIDPDRLIALWAKQRSTDPGQVGYHPLLYHLIDVAMVAKELWETVLTASEREEIAGRLHLSEPEAEAWVAFLAGAHDVGKASPAFQLQVPEAAARLAEAGFPVRAPVAPAPHGTISARTLRRVLTEQFGLSVGQAAVVADAVGGHHGSFPSSLDVQRAVGAAGRGVWSDSRQGLLDALASVLSLPEGSKPAIDTATALWLAGFVSVADWIGSNQDLFPFAAPDRVHTPPYDASYPARARRQARDALRQLGWLAQPPLDAAAPFERMFGYTPNAMQRAIIRLDEQLTEPGVVIIEAPTGMGKTEAALFLADQWGRHLGQRGFYVALPTQATSNQMFDRITAYLRRRFPQEAVNLQLLHGHASLSAAFQELRREGYRLFQPGDVAGDDAEGLDPGVAAAEWFTHRKRGLLAPFGVGTVDQILLAILQTRHVFVRLFGLAHKTVIIDEVHAYDTYMSTLLDQLLLWLGALGSSVVLLSATLPNERRRGLAEAYHKGLQPDAPLPQLSSPDYPRLTCLSVSSASTEHIPTDAQPPILLRWIAPLLQCLDEGSLGERLSGALAGGGTAAVICNTVGRAQEVYTALKPYFPGTCGDGAPELDLLHARFLYHDRAERERRTLRRFGSPDVQGVRRPARAVLVSTQIIEQSLDLDFDLMVTDLAPVDLILQRAGRLHRHKRNRRPIKSRSLWIAGPTRESTIPAFDRGTAAVYFPHILLRSWLALRDRSEIRVPDDVQGLIEEVYGDRDPASIPPELQGVWQDTLASMDAAQSHDESEAFHRYIREPEDTAELAEIARAAREEEAPELHPEHQALTRLTEPSVTLIVLESAGGAPRVDGHAINLRTLPDSAQVARLLERSATVTDRRVVFTLMQEEPPMGWQRSPLLRRCRLLGLDEGGRREVGAYTLRLDPELGLIIDKTGGRQ